MTRRRIRRELETAAGAIASAQRALGDVPDDEEPQKEPEPEPEPAPEPPPRRKPQGGDARVDVKIGHERFTWDLPPGVHPKMAGEQPVLVVHCGDHLEVLFCNPFRGGPEVMRPHVNVQVNHELVTRPDLGGSLEITGGRAIPFHADLGFNEAIGVAGVGPEAQQAALQPLAKGRYALGGFGVHKGREVFCWNEVKGIPGQANQGSGALIYPHVGYWEDHVLGRILSHRMMRGWLSRLSIFRYEEEAWRRGELGLDVYRGGYYAGVGVDQLDGYSRPLKGDAGDLDQEHLGRAAHIVNRWADRGDKLAALFQDALYVDVVHRWGASGFKADQLNRAFAQSLFVATAMERRTSTSSMVERMVDLADNLQREDGSIYFIPQFSDKWEKKIRAKCGVLGFKPAPGEKLKAAAERCRAHFAAQPDAHITVAFEEQLVCTALKQAEDYLGVPREDSVWGRLADELTPWPSEVRFPDNPGLETDKIQGWGHLLDPWRVVGKVSLAGQAKNNPIGDGPTASWAPPWP